MGIYEELLKEGNFPVCSKEEARGVIPEEPELANPANYANTLPPVVQHLFYDLKRYRTEHIPNINLESAYDLMNQMAEPFYAQFVDTTDNQEFLRIANEFFHASFWKGYVYVGKYTYEQLTEWIEEDEAYATFLNLADGKEHYHLFYDGGADPSLSDRPPIFTHLETGQIFQLDDWKENLIKFRWGRPNNTNIFKRWFTFAVKVILQEQNFDDLEMLAKKRAVFMEANERVNNMKIEELQQMLVRDSTLVALGTGDLIEEKTFLAPNELIDYQKAGYMRRDRWISELGIVANTNPKMERLTTGENYKDIVSVADRQRANLNNLKYFAMQVKEQWGDELNFALNGIPQRANMEGDQEQATMPNENPNDLAGGKF